MNYNDIRLPEEIQMQQDLFETIQGEAVLLLAQKVGPRILNQNQNFLQSIHSTCFQVTANSSPRYYKIFSEVLKKLEFTEPINFYIKAHPELNAFSVMSEGKAPHAIVMHSTTLKILNENELRQVVGHELGHIIMRQGKLFPVLNLLQGQINDNPSLKHKVTLWQQLSELSADRFGFLAMPDLNSSITSNIKFSAGMTPEELLDDYDIDYDGIIKNAFETVLAYQKNYGVNTDAHPIEALRLIALNMFSQSHWCTEGGLNNEQLNEQMQALYPVIENVADSEIDVIKARFYASAGLIVSQADGEINNDELDHIYNMLSEYQIFPKEFFLNIAKEDYVSIFEESVHQILASDPQSKDLREKILQRLIHISFADQNVRTQEINVVLHIATSLLGYSEKQAAQLYLDIIHKHFMPNPEDVF